MKGSFSSERPTDEKRKVLSFAKNILGLFIAFLDSLQADTDMARMVREAGEVKRLREGVNRDGGPEDEEGRGKTKNLEIESLKGKGKRNPPRGGKGTTIERRPLQHEKGGVTS